MSRDRVLYGRGTWAFVSLLLLLAPLAIRAGETSYVERGATWKFFRGLQEASSPTTAWRAPAFDDSSWPSGSAPFGYDDGPFGTDLSTLNPPMEDNYSCVFLRKTFVVADPDAVVQLDIRADYDDGFVAWINGTEVLRANVSGPVDYDEFADGNHESGSYEDFELSDPGGYLISGTNVLAVQVFNNQISSSDLKLDLDLVDPIGPDLTPPVVEVLVPAGGATVRQLTQIEVKFNEAVTGVDAGDLLIEGSPAGAVTGTGPGPYTFTFAEPAQGTVDVEWATANGITDTAVPSNAFEGGSWSYTLDPDAPLADLVITEILAANRDGLTDEDGERSDWFEILNRGSVTADLTGWAATDDPDDGSKWVFPSANLDPGERLVVFASGKDRRNPAGNLHTSFKMNSEGEYLALLTPDSPRRVVSEFDPFPEQRPDFSYGLTGTGELAYLDPPTPGSSNATASTLEGIVLDPEITPLRGFYEGPVTVEIFTPTPGAAIYYTLDGREPTTSATPYTGSFQVAGTAQKAVVTVRAAAYRAGSLPSRVMTNTYIHPGYVLVQPDNPQGFPSSWGGAPAADYGMDPQVVNDPAYEDDVYDGLLEIPSLSIVMSTNDMFGSSGLYSNPTGEGVQWERPCSVELIYPSGRDGFQIECGIRIQGGASRNPGNSPKHSLRFLFKGDYGPTKLRHQFFEDSKVDSFDTITLRANYNNSWIHWDSGQRSRGSLIRDQWARDTQLAMGQVSSHGTYMHVYLNGLYWGVYNPVERPSAPFAASHFGGEKEEYDALNSAVAVDGDTGAWSTLLSRVGSDLSSLTNYERVEEYLDVPAFIDYMIMNIYGANDDWPSHNWYAVRRRLPGAQYRFISWDAERIMEGNTSNKTGVSNSNSPGVIYARLRSSAEFRLLFADHLHRHFFNRGAMTPQEVTERWMRRAREIDNAVVCESARWGDYRRDVHSSRNGPYEFYRRDQLWYPEQERLVDDHFQVRSSIVLNQFRSIDLYPDVNAPIFNQHGGVIEPGFDLTLRVPPAETGTMYYTTDGADPRVYGTGGVSASATAYTAAIRLDDATHVKARTRRGTEWSALTEAQFSVLELLGNLRVTEIMYHPEGGGEFEFIELQNVANYSLDLTGAVFSNGIDFAFPPGVVLGPGEYLVLVSDIEQFEDRYPGVPVFGVYLGSLDNSGEKVTLKDDRDRTVFSVDYDDDGFWPIGPDGFGFSLVNQNPGGNPDDPLNWRASAEVYGSPGEDDLPASDTGILIHEVLANANPPFEDAVELHNPTDRTIDLGGWYLSNSRADATSLRKYRFSPGTGIPAGGYLVVYEYQFNPEAGVWPSFDLAGMGGEVYLASADPDGNLTGHIVGHRFDAMAPQTSMGVYTTSIGPDFTVLSDRTFGEDQPASLSEFRAGTGLPNSMPQVGPVVINEIHYHPELGGDEFVELLNISGSLLSLAGWRLSGVRTAEGEEDYEFPGGTQIEAGGYLLLVGTDPATFGDRYSVPGVTPISGPFAGGLDNAGETLKLLQPAGEPGAYLVVDRVRFNDRVPWPLDADGAGPSLERVRAGDYGNDPVNWEASLEIGGTPGWINSVSDSGVNQRPVASFAVAPQPTAYTVLVDASGSDDPDGQIIQYDWDFGDGTVGQGETAIHTFPGAGTYSVMLTVEDNAGATSSTTRPVTVSDGNQGGLQVPGDANQDAQLDISDAVTLLFHLFVGSDRPLPCEPESMSQAGNQTLLDINQDGGVDLTDAVYTLNYLFRGGDAPVLGGGCVRIPGCPDVCSQ